MESKRYNVCTTTRPELWVHKAQTICLRRGGLLEKSQPNKSPMVFPLKCEPTNAKREFPPASIY